jgi:hypothetical protein
MMIDGVGADSDEIPIVLRYPGVRQHPVLSNMLSMGVVQSVYAQLCSCLRSALCSSNKKLYFFCILKACTIIDLVTQQIRTF